MLSQLVHCDLITNLCRSYPTCSSMENSELCARQQGVVRKARATPELLWGLPTMKKFERSSSLPTNLGVTVYTITVEAP